MHKGRSMLTILGVVVGITTIIIILSIGEGLKNIILSQMGSFGSDTVFVEVSIPEVSEASKGIYMGSGLTIDTLKISEVEGLNDEKAHPEIKDVYAVQMGQSYIVHDSEEMKATIFATNPSFIDIDSSEVEYGRFFTEEEEESLSKVIVLGSEIAERLFPYEDPIGQYVKFDKISWRVVGVMKSKGVYFFMNFDKQAYVPLETYRKLVTGMDFVPYMVAQVKDTDRMDIVKEDLVDYFWEKHDIETADEEDFLITTMDEALEMVDVIMGGIRLLLGAIAAISLLVGGVGIMNIMLVSVSERTHEIGLRKAVGAKRASILLQFLWEAVVVTLVGGLVGIFLGTVITYLVTLGAQYAGFEWAFSFSLEAVFLGLFVSVLSGVVFGLYPAWKGSKLDPIVALRKE